MEQDTNREYLKKLLDFLRDRILSIPGNQWFAKELYKLLAPVSDAKISDIHEQCIESILIEQANEFYKDFVIAELRPQLIADFIKMEHWRRRNNIQEFCLALYQQMEAIVNYLGRDESLNLIWRNIRNAGFFVDKEAKDIRVREGETIEDKIIYNESNYSNYRNKPELKDLLAMDKYKAILFLVGYNTIVYNTNKRYFFNDFFTGQNIYYARNLNHRGNSTELSDNVKRILENPVHSMYTLLDFYLRFAERINKNYPINKDLIEFAETCCKSNTY